MKKPRDKKAKAKPIALEERVPQPTGIFNCDPRYLTVLELRERLSDPMIHENDFTNIVDVKRSTSAISVTLIRG